MEARHKITTKSSMFPTFWIINEYCRIEDVRLLGIEFFWKLCERLWQCGSQGKFLILY